MNASGVPLPAGAATCRSRRSARRRRPRFRSRILNPCGQFGTRADTSGNSIVTTDGQCDAVATGGAQGSTNLFLPQPTATPTETPTPTATATPTPTETATADADRDTDGDADTDRDRRPRRDADADGDGDPDADRDRQPPRRRRPRRPTESPTTDLDRERRSDADAHGERDADADLDRVARARRALPVLRDPPPGLGDPVTVTLNDVFGDGTVKVKRAKRICAPADKNDEDPDAPTSAVDHLKAYEINQTNKFTPVKKLARHQPVRQRDDQPRPTRLHLGAGGQEPRRQPARRSSRRSTTTSATRSPTRKFRSLGDQGRRSVRDAERRHQANPVRFCAAADKNGEGIVDPEAHLMCYRSVPPKGQPRFKGPNDLHHRPVRQQRPSRSSARASSACRRRSSWTEESGARRSGAAARREGKAEACGARRALSDRSRGGCAAPTLARA